MAKVFPTFENIERLKVQPTKGEMFLLKYLEKNFSDDVEVYFQPFLQGDRPDIILLQKNVGLTIIEVKDWNLDKYKIDENNHWYLISNNQILRSPYQQVYKYKDNMFNLHISGLLEKKIQHKSFYGRIKPFVYFHYASKEDLNTLYNKAENKLKAIETENTELFKKSKNFDHYEKKRLYIKQKKKQLIRDLNYCAIGNDSLEKISLPQSDDSHLFDEKIYKEFQRHLNPPLHTLDEGKDIVYTKEQKKYYLSSPIHEKIRGVAGSGKTTLLAKRAVNAHKRHGQMVLILTFNLTLKSYIHDKISDVRENFGWRNFFIINYHEFFKLMANDIDKDINYNNGFNDYDDLSFFEQFASITQRFKTIIIDETQDYKPEWIKITRKYFLDKHDGEMILFGDEKQNIYERSLDEKKKFTTPHGFGSWKELKKPIRQHGDGGRILTLSKKFQSAFFRGRYDIDELEANRQASSLGLDIYKIANSKNTYNDIALSIYQEIKNNNIHNNDVVILSSKIDILQNIEQIIRKEYGQKTITTFETIEMNRHEKDKPINEIDNIRRNKKIAFNLNSGAIKLSTIHSFKGFEADTVFLILNENDAQSNGDEIIYTAITRSKHNLMVFSHPSNKYNEFFTQELQSDGYADQSSNIIEDLKSAIKNKKFINIAYSQHDETINFENVKPYKILFMEENYYLASEVDNGYKFSMFRISKIEDVKIQNNEFYPDTDIKDFISEIQTPFSKYRENFKDYMIDILVEIDKTKAAFFTAKKFLPSQEIVGVKETGDLLVNFKVTQEREIEYLIKQWIPYIKVIVPLSLDEKIKSDLRKYLL